MSKPVSGRQYNLTEQSVAAARRSRSCRFMMLTINLGIIGILWFGGVQFIAGNMQLGQIIAFVNYLTMTLFSLIMVSQLIIQLARAEPPPNASGSAGEQPKVQDVQRADGFHLPGPRRVRECDFQLRRQRRRSGSPGRQFRSRTRSNGGTTRTTGRANPACAPHPPFFYDVISRITIDGQDVARS